MKIYCAILIALALPIGAQTIPVTQIRPSSTPGQVITTVGGQTQWATPTGGGGTPGGGSYAIQYDNAGALGGANFTGFVYNNGNTSAPSLATQSQAFALLGGTPGFLGSSQSWAGANTFNGIVALAASTPAVSGTNVNSPIFSFSSNYWNGTASAVDTWTVQAQPGIGTNPIEQLVFAASGSPGARSFKFNFGVTATQFVSSGQMIASGAIISTNAVETSPSGSVTAPANNLSSPPLSTIATFWNGSIAASDSWSWIDVIGTTTNTPTSTYTLSKPTTTGGAVAVSMPFTVNTNGTSKFVNNVGMQIATSSGCTTSAAVLATCIVTISLPVAEPDTSYSVSGCIFEGSTLALIANATTFTTTNFLVTEMSGLSSGTTGGAVSCLVTHN